MTLQPKGKGACLDARLHPLVLAIGFLDGQPEFAVQLNDALVCGVGALDFATR